MKNSNTSRILLILIVVLILGFLIWPKKHAGTPVSPQDNNAAISNTDLASSSVESIIGCYVFTSGKDTYTLNVQTGSGIIAAGELTYKNYQKDSSAGTFNGVYTDHILSADYEFESEGMVSSRQISFKKLPAGFVEGTGESVLIGNKSKFVDINTITYDKSRIFAPATCVNE